MAGFGAPTTTSGSNLPGGIAATPSTDAGPMVLPSVDEVEKGAAIPFAPKSASGRQLRSSRSRFPALTLAARIYGGRWRPLALAPLLTLSSLLGFRRARAHFW